MNTETESPFAADDLGALLPHEITMIRNFRKSNDSDQRSIALYAAECAIGWEAYPDAGTYRLDPPDDLIHLHDLSFDFDAYFERGLDAMSDAEKDEYQARIYGMFCRDVMRSGGDMRRVSFWAANYIAERMFQALGGVPWEEIMGLPWDEPTEYYNANGVRALDIYSGVEAGKKSGGIGTTTLLAQQAEKHSVSYETARADYYDIKRAITTTAPMPKKFLNKDFGS